MCFPVDVVLCNQAVEHNVAVFQSFPLLYAGREGYAEASTRSNSASVKLLTIAARWTILLKKSMSVR